MSGNTEQARKKFLRDAKHTKCQQSPTRDEEISQKLQEKSKDVARSVEKIVEPCEETLEERRKARKAHRKKEFKKTVKRIEERGETVHNAGKRKRSYASLEEKDSCSFEEQPRPSTSQDADRLEKRRRLDAERKRLQQAAETEESFEMDDEISQKLEEKSKDAARRVGTIVESSGKRIQGERKV